MNQSTFRRSSDEFTRRVNNIISTGYNNFGFRIGDFLEFLQNDPIFAPQHDNLVKLINLDEWIEKNCTAPQGMVGSGQFNWPRSQTERHSVWIQLLDRFQDFDEVIDFSSNYHYVDGDFNQYAYEISSQYIRPFADDFLKYVEQKFEDAQLINDFERLDDSVTIPLEKDNPEYEKLTHQLDEFLSAVEASNELSAHSIDKKQQISTELGAARSLLNPNLLRVKPFTVLVAGAIAAISLITSGALSAMGSDLWQQLKTFVSSAL